MEAPALGTSRSAEPTALSSDPAPSAARIRGESWERLPLLSGLELHVRSDASPLVRRVVEEIRGYCVAAAAD
jgi:hypothetical protein